MNRAKLITYWVATALLSIGMLQSGIFAVLSQMSFAKPPWLIQATQVWIDMVIKLGYPQYFLTILGVWKILGVIAILLPGFKLAKEWAYAGFFFAMTGALVSHLAVGDYEIKAILGPTFQAIFVLLSWYFRPASRKVVIG